MRFSYKLFKAPLPIISLGGQIDYPRPIVPATIIGSGGAAAALDVQVDSGADETLFAEFDAQRAGVDLTNAPVRIFGGIVQAGYTARFAQVTLRMTDGVEFREWRAWVGFVSGLRRSVLGFSGAMQFFTTTFYGDDQIVELTTNRLYPGR